MPLVPNGVLTYDHHPTQHPQPTNASRGMSRTQGRSNRSLSRGNRSDLQSRAAMIVFLKKRLTPKQVPVHGHASEREPMPNLPPLSRGMSRTQGRSNQSLSRGNRSDLQPRAPILRPPSSVSRHSSSVIHLYPSGHRPSSILPPDPDIDPHKKVPDAIGGNPQTAAL
jgi:hypothetical protein